MGETKKPTSDQRERDHLGNVGVDGRRVLKLILDR
jgi:hypothetical protein